jgi:hypothetical protein
VADKAAGSESASLTLDARLKALQKERAEVESLKDPAATLARREAKRQKVLGKAQKPSLFRRFLREALREGEEADQAHLLHSFVHKVLVQPDGLLLFYHPFVLTDGPPFDPDDNPGGGPKKERPVPEDGPAVQLVARACHLRNSRFYIVADLQALFELYVKF